MLPQEAAARRILPLLRAAVARLLVERGVSQHRAARLLGVTQPMVHRYAAEPLDSHLAGLEAEGVPRRVAEAIVEVAAREVESGGEWALARLLNWATVHSRYCRGRPCHEVLCVGPQDYRLLLEALLSIEGFDRLIPEVGSNLAYAPRHARSEAEVLALDGRIVRAGGRPVAAGAPVLGGSRHTARTALAYKEAVGGEAWAIALRHSEALLGALRRLGATVVELGSPVEGPVEAVAAVEPGGVGREPVVYLVAGDPATLYWLASRLAREESR